MQTQEKIAVAGATGRVGRHVVDVLTDRGYEVSEISRSRGVDVITGAGLAEALTGVRCVIDTATGPSPDQAAATEFFTTATRNLHDAGVQRIVVVSIINCDRFSAGHNAAKFAHEQAMRSGPLPVAVLRAAQFHEFVGQLLDWGTQGGTCSLPTMRAQFVAARTVAEALADLAVAPDEPAADIPEIAGPRAESLVEMARLLAARRDDPVRIEAVSDPDDPDRELFESGGLLPGPNAVLAGPTFEDWLPAYVPSRNRMV